MSVWSVAHFNCLDVQMIGSVAITAMIGLHGLLWTATRSGLITVYSLENDVWQAMKTWQAHRDAVVALRKNCYSTGPGAGTITVLSVGADGFARLWDGLLSRDWLDMEMAKKAPQFSSYRSLRVSELTYNIDAASPADMLGNVDNMEVFQRVLRSACSFPSTKPNVPNDGFQFADELSSPDIIVVALQELVNLSDTRITAKHLLLGHKKKLGSEFADQVSSQCEWTWELAA